jgi:signal transduction histidine kinase/ActR/RegA family two-component response regulator
VEATATHDVGQRWTNVRARQLELLCTQANRAPLAAAVGSLLVTYVAWGHASAWLIAAWLLCMSVIGLAQFSFTQHALRRPPADPLRALRVHLLSSFTAGVATGSAAVLLFARLPLQGQALLTVILMCWTAATASATAAHARAFQAHTLAVLVPLALLWASAGSIDDVMLGILIAMFGVLLSRLARDSEQAVRTSLEINRDNERLIQDLARERHEAGLAREAAQNADHAKSRFLAAASHDLRQPLHALSLYSAAMHLRRLDGDMAQISSNIDQAVASLSALVDSLLDVSRLDAGTVRPKLQRIDLKPFLEQIGNDLQPLADKRGLDLRLSTSNLQVESDPALLERLVRNLVDNAIKYTAEGGVTVRAEIDDGDVRIAVCDTGPGIAVEERSRIFEEFYQIGNPERDRAQGLGLGLSIVRRLAIVLNLRIELETAAGQGSTFAVRLAPARNRTVVEPARTDPLPPERSLAGVEILVIDDEPAVRISMRTLLESWGCRVLVCSGFAEAAQTLEQQPFDAQVIVSDLRLRQHENGIETVRALQKSVGAVPALLVSGDTSPERLREVHASGLPLLHKPVTAARLKETLLTLLAKQPPKPNGVDAKVAKEKREDAKKA